MCLFVELTSKECQIQRIFQPNLMLTLCNVGLNWCIYCLTLVYDNHRSSWLSPLSRFCVHTHQLQVHCCSWYYNNSPFQGLCAVFCMTQGLPNKNCSCREHQARLILLWRTSRTLQGRALLANIWTVIVSVWSCGDTAVGRLQYRRSVQKNKCFTVCASSHIWCIQI